MSLTRYALSFLLSLALAGAPVVQTLAMDMSATPDMAAMQGVAAVAHHAGTAALESGQTHQSCAQHDICDGQCCAHCAQCLVGLLQFPVRTDISRTVLTPFVYSLAFYSPTSPRERPPRILSR